MTPMLQRIFASEGGSDVLDILMAYLYKGMAVSHPEAARKNGARGNLTPQATGFSQMGGRPTAADPTGAQMSVLLSWHEKVVDVAGPGCIVRCMTDRRRI
jgi:actin related protein 2/3 complex subunit 5